MVMTDLLPWALLAVGILLVVGVFVLLWRKPNEPISLAELTIQIQTLKSDLERIERTIRDNDARSFNSAEDRGKALRVEVSDTIGRSTTTLVTSLTAVGDAQKAQLESFATVLATSTNAVGDDLRTSTAHAAELQKAQLDAFAKQLAEGVRTLDERMESLRRAVDQKTNDLIQTLTSKVDGALQANALQAQALRGEVGVTIRTLGDDLRVGSTTSAEHQKEQLDGFATLLGDGLKSLDGRMESLRQIVDQRMIDLINTLTAKLDSCA